MGRGRPFKCPYESCGSTESVSKGVRRTKTMGLRKIRKCRECGRKFTPKNQRPSEDCTEDSDQQPMPDPIEQPSQALESDQGFAQSGVMLSNPSEDEYR